MRPALVLLQGVTFVLLGGVLFLEGYWRLGLAQVLLAVVQVVVYG